MKRTVILFLAGIWFLGGCAATQRGALPKSAKISPSVPRVSAGRVQKPSEPIKGFVFFKAVFVGVVQASYARLTVTPQDTPLAETHLYIGDPNYQQSFPWIPGTVRPQYFTVELPAGAYRFAEIAIPVGTTMAVEPMDVTFSVEPNKAVYLGTLWVQGTRERIRLGGVPILRPGFEYEIKILDERGSAVSEFLRRVPRFRGEIQTRLMQGHSHMSSR